MTDEGYVKYSVNHTTASVAETPELDELNNARTELYKLKLIGVYPDGIGFGNVSVRFKNNEFIISGTATGGKPVLTKDDYCLVKSFNIEQNHVDSLGAVWASSESMTHGAVYASCPKTNCVIHIHSRAIFDGMLRDKYPATPESAAYGTPEIAYAIGACIKHELTAGRGEGQIVLAGHEEGVIAYGECVDRAFHLILELYNKYGG